MKKRIFLIAAIVISAIVLFSCSFLPQNDIQDDTDDTPIPEGMTQVTLNLGGAKAPDIDNVTWGTLTITGGGMDTMIVDVSAGLTTIQVPSGPFREFTLTGRTSSAFYSGYTVETLIANTSQTIDIPMTFSHTAIAVPDNNNFRVAQIDDISGINWLTYTMSSDYEPIDTDIDNDGNLYMFIEEFGGEGYSIAYIPNFTGEDSGTDWNSINITYPNNFQDMAVDPVTGETWIVTSEIGGVVTYNTVPVFTSYQQDGTASTPLYLDDYIVTVLPSLNPNFEIPLISFNTLGNGIFAVQYTYWGSAEDEYQVLEIFDVSGGTWNSIASYSETGSGSLFDLYSDSGTTAYSSSYGINYADDQIILYGAGAWGDPPSPSLRSLVFDFDGTNLSGPTIYTVALPLANSESYYFIEPITNGTNSPLFRITYTYGAAAPIPADRIIMYDDPTFSGSPTIFGGDKGTEANQFDFYNW